jgi:hypothetical protein
VPDEEIVDVVEEAVDEPEVPEQPDESAMWRGRLKKEQDEKAALLANVRSQLPAGWDIDETGRAFEVAPQQTYRQPMQPAVTEPEIPDFNDEWGNVDPAKILAEVDRRTAAQMAAAMTSILPVLENSTASQMSTKYPDWSTIQADVMQLAKENGIPSLIAAQQNPVVMNTLVLAARGKQMANAAAAVPVADDTALNAMVTGGGGASPASGANKYGYTADELAGLASIGMSPEQAYNLQGGAKIDITGGTK